MTLQEAYESMYYDLIINRLDVTLVPSINPDRAANGCCSRVVVSRNPKWYREFCGKYLDKRKKTIIKRKDIIRILDRLRKGNTSVSMYKEDLLDIANDMIEEEPITEDDINFFMEFGELPKPFVAQF